MAFGITFEAFFFLGGMIEKASENDDRSRNRRDHALSYDSQKHSCNASRLFNVVPWLDCPSLKNVRSFFPSFTSNRKAQLLEQKRRRKLIDIKRFLFVESETTASSIEINDLDLFMGLVVGSWLDLSKLVTSDASEHGSAFPEFAHDIGKEENDLSIDFGILGADVYVDINGWHLFLKDITVSPNTKLHSLIAQQLAPDLMSDGFNENQVTNFLKKVILR